jgi:pimeloyl-ACP methyl ester carboxylesterase
MSTGEFAMLMLVLAASTLVPPSAPPPPIGRLIDLGGHRLHLHCTGRGQPTVVVENGLGDFSFDWILVQRMVEKTTRICTYDRGGYAWSDPGPKPRTFDQLNLELRDALRRAGERAPFVLVGHSYGGGVVRAYTRSYRDEVAGLVFVDIVSEDQYITMGRHAGRVRDGAKGVPIPPAHEDLRAGDVPEVAGSAAAPAPIESLFTRLPPREQQLHAWAAALPTLEDAENSQREWSAEYFAKWASENRDGSLGPLPLIVLTRATGGYGDNLDVPAAELEKQRLDSQRALARLSSAGTQQIVESGHNMHLEAPGTVAAAIQSIVRQVRSARTAAQAR